MTCRRGPAHTVRATVSDKDGGVGPAFAASFTVLGDRVLRNASGGSVRLNWTAPDSAGIAAVAPGELYRFEKQVTGLRVELLTSGADYHLQTNFQVDSVDARGCVVAMTVQTDSLSTLPAYAQYAGSGAVGSIYGLGDSSTVDVRARGDFGGLYGTGVTSNTLSFANLTGRIGVARIGSLLASGSIAGPEVRVGGGVDRVAGYSLGNIATRQDPSSENRPLEITYGAGGQVGIIDRGGQPGMVFNLDSAGRVAGASLRNGSGLELNGYAYLYDATGKLAGVRDSKTGVVSAPWSAPPAGATLSTREVSHDGNGWLRSAWGQAVTVYTDLASGVAYTVEAAGAVAQEAWTKAGETVTWAGGAAGGALTIAGRTIGGVAQAAAESFMKQVEAFGGDLRQFFDKIGELGSAAQDVMRAIVNDPAGFINNVLAGITGGLNQFVANLPGALPAKIFEWLTKDAVVPQLPTQFDSAHVGPWLLEFFHLNWDGIQDILAEAAGAGNAAALAQMSQDLLAAWEKSEQTGEIFGFVNAVLGRGDPGGADLSAGGLTHDALAAMSELVMSEIARKLPAFIITKLNPGGAVLSTVYNTVTWLIDEAGKFPGLADKLAGVIQAVGDIARNPPPAQPGDPTPVDKLATAVRTALESSIPVAISFGASQLRLQGLPELVGGTLRKLENGARQRILTAAKVLAGKAKLTVGMAPGQRQFDGLVGPVVTFNINGVEHKLWVVNQGGVPAVMRASSPLPRKTAAQLLADFDHHEGKLATDAELKAIQAIEDEVLRLSAKQIADDAVASSKTSTAAARKAATKRLAGQADGIKAKEQALTAAIEAATKTYFTFAQDQAEFVKSDKPSWGDWLQRLDNGKDTLGELNRIHVNAGGPDGQRARNRPSHAHHIVMKQWDKGAADESFLARSVLWTANAKLNGADAGKLNPYLGLWNFVWAPKWGHSHEYARDVLNRLKEVKNDGPSAVHEVLKKIALDQIRGHWYKNGGGVGDVSDQDT